METGRALLSTPERRVRSWMSASSQRVAQVSQHLSTSDKMQNGTQLASAGCCARDSGGGGKAQRPAELAERFVYLQADHTHLTKSLWRPPMRTLLSSLSG